ncbi:hypothetical protein KEM55_007134, partial [Ascosphaera atra]
DPWALAASRQRKAANLSRQQELRAQREAALGQPLRGKETPFIQTLKPGKVAELSEWAQQQAAKPQTAQQRQQRQAENKMVDSTIKNQLNFFVTKEELEESLERSKRLTAPFQARDRSTEDIQAFQESLKEHEEMDKRAREAIKRIVNLKNGNNKDQTRVNVMRCIETFGRHNTDKILPPRLPSYSDPPSSADAQVPGKNSGTKERLGPDTGSEEVQVAILTAKIEVLAKQLETTSHKDKHNKRNLRLLVHRRQKLLKYLRRKDRGGPRWQYLMNTLGLTDASWKGEISM